jgi:hypothetical protein
VSFLTLNGVTLFADSGKGVDRDDFVVGQGVVRAFDGSVFMSAQGYKRTWKLSFALDLQANTAAWRNWLLGKGDHWSFENNDLYSDKGTALATGGTASVQGSGAKYGTYCLSTANNATITLNGLLAFQGWTLMLWKQDTNGGAYHHYLVIGSQAGGCAAVYKDGVQQAASYPTFINTLTYNNTLSLSSIILVNNTGNTILWDELVLLPFAMPTGAITPGGTTVPAQLYAFHNGQAWPLMPKLLLGGDLVNDTGTTLVIGKAGSTRTQMANISGTFYHTAAAEALELWEV